MVEVSGMRFWVPSTEIRTVGKMKTEANLKWQVCVYVCVGGVR